ncbi:efflux RND transporter permease subunit [Escherichia coli]
MVIRQKRHSDRRICQRSESERGRSDDGDAAACRQRLRPILMTSLAFIFGVLPMALTTGAGSGGQHAVGTGVVGGMVSATILAIFFVPLFFVLARRRFPLKEKPE